MRVSDFNLARNELPEGGSGEAANGEDDRRIDARLRLVNEVINQGISRGVGHLIAEDDHLGGRFVTLRGRRQVNFGSCSYLGLETDLRLKNAACDAVTRFGVQFSSSRSYVSCPPYAEFEHILEAMFEAPLVLAPTTTLAHLAALPILVRREDAVICDQLVHNSVQAVLPTLKAAGTFCRPVRHNRMDRLEEMISALSRHHRRVWYLADGIYSMHGGAAPLAELRQLSARHEQLHLYIDDAHGISWSGKNGRGTVLGHGPPPPRTVVVGSLAKGFAGCGGVIVLPDAETASLIRNCGSTMIFSGPLQPAVLGAGIASARIHLSSEIYERQDKLLERIRLFNSLAAARGIPLASTDATPLRLVKIEESEATYQITSDLMGEGFYVNSAVFPAVSRDQGGLRIALTLHQTLDDIRGLIDAIAKRL